MPMNPLCGARCVQRPSAKRTCLVLLLAVSGCARATQSTGDLRAATVLAIRAAPLDSICRNECSIALASPVVSRGVPGTVTDSFYLDQEPGAVLRDGRVRLLVGSSPSFRNADTAALRAYVHPSSTSERITVLVEYRASRGGYFAAAIWVVLRRTRVGWEVVRITTAPI